jgi:ketosteroid isomerase-like protein
MHDGRALQPEDLDRLFLERANAGDVDGVVALYEPHAVLAFPAGRLAIGAQAIREAYADLLAGPRRFTGVIRPAIRNGDIAITSTTRDGNVGGGPPSARWHLAVDDRPAERPGVRGRGRPRAG